MKWFQPRSPAGTICTWCQRESGNRFHVWERDPFLDVLTCTTCGGTSLFRWEMAMIYIGPLDPPKPKFRPNPSYDIANARLVS